MTRSRIVLMVAWGLLAAGTAVQFVQATRDDGGSSTEPSNASADPPERVAAAAPTTPPADDGRAAGPSGRIGEFATGGPDREPGREPDGDDGPDGDDASDGSTLADDPSGWAAALPPAPAIVATVTGDGVASRPEPGSGAPTHWFPNPTQFGGDRAFLVIDDTTSDEWVKVSLPVMPNGQQGWIPRSEVELSTVTHRAEVDLSEATVSVWDGDELLFTTGAVTGKASAPTPLGRFYIRDIIAQPDPDGAYGPWILALSGFSEVLETFQGGLPALALHGTDQPNQIGSAISSGCVRVPNDIITTLAETVPLGTPVTIVA